MTTFIKTHRTTRQRLAYYRGQAASAKNGTAQNWKYWKRDIWSAPSNCRGDSGEMFTEDVRQIGGYIGEYSEIIRGARHNGYYVDHHLSGVLKGGVCKLRTPKGALYVPVTFCTEWDGSTHYLQDAVHVPKGAAPEGHGRAAEDAARIADSIAEREAEKEREYQAKEAAREQIEQCRADIHELNKKALPVLQAIKRGLELPPEVCRVLREKLSDYSRERAAAFKRIEKLEDNYWLAVDGY